MRILAIIQGQYGTRKVDNIRSHGPSDWTVEVLSLPHLLPNLIDDPDEFLPPQFPQADLILALGESVGAAQLIPSVVRRTGAKAVIAPIDNSAWLPEGLKNQLQKELSQMGVASVFPKPFCTLTEDSYGYRRRAQTYHDPLISAFARHFGRPKFQITVNPQTKTIERVEVIRDATCGNARYVAQGLVGVSVEEAEYQAGMLHHHYPCLCSMTKEWLDDRIEDTLMHASGYIMREEVESQVKPFKAPPQYVTPTGRVNDPDEKPSP